MNTTCLNDFLGIIDRAKSIVRFKNSTNDLIEFNEYNSFFKYKGLIDDKYNTTFLEHLSNLDFSIEAFSIYMSYLIPHLNSLLGSYKTKCGLLIHDKLIIIDTEGYPHSYSELSDETKKSISAYLTIQKTALVKLITNINQKEIANYLSSVTESKKSYGKTGKVNQNNSAVPSKNNSGEIMIKGELYYNNQKVCMMLDATKRTLQRYRVKNILPFKQVSNKYFYKVSDVEELFNNKPDFL